MDAAPPRISVVLAVRNGATTLQRALDSIAAQTHRDVELIAIDGASTDGSLEILQRSASRFAYWVSEPDKGIYDAWNKALDHVTGDWVCFLGADDQFAGSDALVRLASDLRVATENIVYGELEVVEPDGSVLTRLGLSWTSQRLAIRHGMALPFPSTLCRRSLFEQFGKFDAGYRIAGDYEFLLRVLLKQEAQFVPGVVVLMGAGGVSDRPDRRVLRLREAERARRKHGLTRIPEGIAPAVLRAKVRELIWRVGGPRAEARLTAAYQVLLRPFRRLGSGAP